METFKNDVDSDSEVEPNSISANISETEDILEYDETDKTHKGESLSNASTSERILAGNERNNRKWPFRTSLFSNIPPSINFLLPSEVLLQDFHPDVKHLLTWKLSSITPSIVRSCVRKSSYRLVKKCEKDWSATWGKSMRPAQFRMMQENQKVNHFPGTFHIGRKDRLWKNYRRLQLKYGEDEFDFLPRTFCLPADEHLLRKEWQKQSKSLWIVKPPAKARGNGIKVISKWNQIPKTRPILVQRYIAKPYLINRTKFDLRLYVLLTSIHPLRIYLYNDGLVRFASKPYSTDSSTAHDVFTHLTNYSINNKSDTYRSNQDSFQAQGHKWTLQALWRYFDEAGVDYSSLWSRITDLVIKTFVSAEKPLRSLFQQNAKTRYSCFELFGFDILLDADLKPWLMEVNISPSMHSSSQLDHDVKSPLVVEVLNMARYHLPTRLPTTLHCKTMGYDNRLYTKELTTQDRIRHLAYNQVLWKAIYEDQTPPDGLLDSLTPDDCRNLVVGEEELTITSRFQRIFPTNETHKYLKYLQCPGYYNLLFHAWEQRYKEKREEGRKVLEKYCLAEYHLQTEGGVSVTNHSLLVVPDQKLDTWDNNHLLNIDKSNITADIINTESAKLQGVPEKDKIGFGKVNSGFPPGNTNSQKNIVSIAQGKKFKSVVVKHFNVKAVNPGSSRGSKLWRLRRGLSSS